nr:hypothetical protein I302_08144 [Kwoniella bestiolae CBS 10118]OCF22494.1 hypothetical protein I302_08144 [Kwoniella bestiolae CBS 10118]
MSSPWLLSVKLIPLFQKSNDPVISNITSLAGVGVERLIAHPAYASAKAAELHLTKLMAANFIPFKIRVNSLSPGLFKSQMTTGSSDAETPVPPVVEQVVKTFPSGREGTWEEIAGVALMLASPAGAHINGADILIDGGGKMVMSAA